VLFCGANADGGKSIIRLRCCGGRIPADCASDSIASGNREFSGLLRMKSAEIQNYCFSKQSSIHSCSLVFPFGSSRPGGSKAGHVHKSEPLRSTMLRAPLGAHPQFSSPRILAHSLFGSALLRKGVLSLWRTSDSNQCRCRSELWVPSDPRVLETESQVTPCNSALFSVLIIRVGRWREGLLNPISVQGMDNGDG